MSERVSVIIPAHNEADSIDYVIKLAQNTKDVNEIIVVNNASTDDTHEVAEKLGAIVLDCANKGKGYAMEEGLKIAKNEVVVYLDADIANYEKDVIEKLANPILKGEAVLSKATFNRTKGGIVTEIVTKPLLRALFPEISEFQEPLSGMIAGKKSILSTLSFEKDYGVDIGILIDMYKMGAKVVEVNIGNLENGSHKNKTNESMAKMSTEIINVILKKAKYIK
jgi:glycosyltransferase involved in cell wall biosynthesis